MTDHEAVSTERQTTKFIAHGCYKVSKIKEQYSDCQDSYDLSTEGTRVAISDGATQSFYSGLWSQILCRQYCSWPNLISQRQWTEWSAFARAQWLEQVNEKLEELKKAGKPSWIECLNGIKLKKDAFATFIGISLEDSYLHGICIGDSCAMLVKLAPMDLDSKGCQEDHSIIRIFPGLWQHSFDSRTTGLSSYNSELNHHPEFFDIPVPAGKEDYRILLMTDALAHYVIDMENKGMSIINSLISLSTPEEFAQYIDKCRETGLANDDATLIIVEIADSAGCSELEKGQGDINCSRSLAIDNMQDEEEFVDAKDVHLASVSLQPSVDPLQLPLLPGSVGADEAKPASTDINTKQEPGTISQSNIAPKESDQELQSTSEIPDQATIGYPNPLDMADAKLVDSTPDKDKKPSPKPLSFVLGKKNLNDFCSYPNTLNSLLRRAYSKLTRSFLFKK